MKKLSTIAILSLSSMFALNGTALAGNFMSESAVKKLVTGKTANGVHLRKGHKYKVFFNANGKLVQIRNDGSKILGKWRVKSNGAHCVKFNHKNREFCRRMRDNRKGAYIKVKERSFKNNLDVVKLWNFVEGDKTK